MLDVAGGLLYCGIVAVLMLLLGFWKFPNGW